MREDLEPDLLTLLEESSNKGCLVIVLHIFSDKMKIGNVILSEDCIQQSSNVGLDLCSTLQSYVNSRLTEFGSLRIFEFSVVYGETVIRVVGEVLETPLRLLIFGA